MRHTLCAISFMWVTMSTIGRSDPYVGTLAGSGQIGFANGIGASASFHTPFGVVVDPATNTVYVADCDNNAIRKVSQSGVVSNMTVSSNVTLDGPTDLVFDSHGNLFVSLIRRHMIVKIASNLAVTAWAGNGSPGSTNGNGMSATFRNPAGLAIDTNDNLYVADSGNNLVRKVTPTGTVSTVASAFNSPWGVAVDPSGAIYVSDTSNHQIKQISTKGKVSVLAGSGTVGSQEGVGLAATFDYPYGIRLDASGNLFVAEYGSNRIRKVTTPLGNVTTYAGGIGGYADGPSLTAKFQHPAGLAFGPDGTMYVADEVGERIRIITTRPRSTAKATTRAPAPAPTPAPTPAPGSSVATSGTYTCDQQSARYQNVAIGLGGSVSIASYPSGTSPLGLDCTFVITATPGRVVKLVFLYLYVYDGDFLVVYEGNGTSSMLQASTSTTAISTGRTMTVVFTTANPQYGWTAIAYDVPVPTTNTLPTCSGGERPDGQCGPMFGQACAPGRCCSQFGWCGAYYQPGYCSANGFSCALPYNETVRASLRANTSSAPATPPFVYCGRAAQVTLARPNDNTWVYSAGMDCAVTITATPGRVVQFMATEASLYGSDTVTIFDGNTTTSPVILVSGGVALATAGSVFSTGRSMMIVFSVRQQGSWWVASASDFSPVPGLTYCSMVAGRRDLALPAPGQQASIHATGANCTTVIDATSTSRSVSVATSTNIFDHRAVIVVYDSGSGVPYTLLPGARPFVSSGSTVVVSFVAVGSGAYTAGVVTATSIARPALLCNGAHELAIPGPGQNVTITPAYMAGNCTVVVNATPGRAVNVLFWPVSLAAGDFLTASDGSHTYTIRPGAAWFYVPFTSYGASVTISSRVAASSSSWTIHAVDVPRPPMPTFCASVMNMTLPCPAQDVHISSFPPSTCKLLITAAPGCTLRLTFPSFALWSQDTIVVTDGVWTYTPWFADYMVSSRGTSLTITSNIQQQNSYWTIDASAVPVPTAPAPAPYRVVTARAGGGGRLLTPTTRTLIAGRPTTGPPGGSTGDVVAYLLQASFTMTLRVGESLGDAQVRFANGESAALGIAMDRVSVVHAAMGAQANTATLQVRFTSTTSADQAALLAALSIGSGVGTLDPSTVQTTYVCRNGQQVTSADRCRAGAPAEPETVSAARPVSPSPATLAYVLLFTVLTVHCQ
ncbi:unnamed protein product (mitochondrion) [Plasmodiophora brassicae]|uniref:CUB domain-containing protein n=1 Tax=Plasmodiophora brassicae TaxID=37360 RepID=A0A3P3YEI9_PLABS|nr:unnamed protein product [Plasmodiophora brassicae]